ncbi:acetate--CoA ligase family protein [Chloroflexota bacterium]
MPAHPLEEIFHPESIAVVGASNTPTSRGYSFTRHLLNYGFSGRIYPINPNHNSILGMPAYPSLTQVPDFVDYVISCVPSRGVLNLINECAQKQVKCIHLFTARFSETGHREAAELEQEVLRQARKWGIRLIGPNCMGLYYPREGISFAYDLPKEPGTVAMVSQTGGGAAVFVQMAGYRGIRFSKVISYGNALDLDESDYLDYLSEDPETKVVIMYIEGVKNGKRFFNSLRRIAAVKPVIVTKGGRGKSGAKIAASHTAALAGSAQVWETAVAQAGALLARDFEEMTDLAVAFCFLPPFRGVRVGALGGGGGASVLAADAFEEVGLDVVPLPEQIREELKSKAHSIWDWISNPVDVSILGGSGITNVDLLRMLASNDNFDLLIANMTEVPLEGQEDTVPRLRNDVAGYIKISKENTKPIMVILGEKSLDVQASEHWRSKLTSELRTMLLESGVPIYSTPYRAARTVRRLADYYCAHR